MRPIQARGRAKADSGAKTALFAPLFARLFGVLLAGLLLASGLPALGLFDAIVAALARLGQHVTLVLGLVRLQSVRVNHSRAFRLLGE